MSDIKNIALRRLDLTVLLVFLGLLRWRKASAVAEELGLTQPAISHALRRLREVFGDTLFLRRPHGLEPTGFALAIEPHVAAAVEALRMAVTSRQDFDPATARGVVRVAAFDAELATLVPELIRAMAEEAPGLQFAGRSLGRKPALEALVTGDIDLALGFFSGLDKTFIPEPLFRENYLVVGARQRHRFEGRLSLEDYVRLPHILVSPGGDLRGVVDDLLAERGLSRHIAAALPLFLPALAAVEVSGAIATLPRRIAERYAGAFDLITVPPPLAIRDFEISAVRHRRDERSPLLNWITARLRMASAGGDG